MTAPRDSIVRRVAPWVGLISLVLLVAAGRPMARQELPFWAAAAILYGVLLWFLLGRFGEDFETIMPVGPGAGGPRLLPLALVFPLAVVAWQKTGGNVLRPEGAACWAAAVAAWLWSWAPPRDRGPAEGTDPKGRRLPRLTVLAALGAITLAAAFFYFHRLAETPGNPTSDHAETLLDLTDLQSGQRPIFFARNTGREPWKFYWLWGLVEVFGLPVKFLTTKVGTATTALLAIPAMFLLGRELGGNRLGLFAAALVSWSKWPVAMARLGIRVSYAILPTAMVLWALVRYFRRGDRASALWCGLWIGIGLYGYIPFRVVPLFVPIVFALAAFDPRWRGKRRRLLLDALVIAATAALVFLPLLHFMLESPDHFWGRLTSRSGDLSRVLSAETLSTFAGNLRNMALAFHWRGDGGWVNFVTRDPFLDVATGGLFLAGIALALSRVARGCLRWLVPLAGIFLLTLPSTLILTFAHENPSVNRSVAAVPAVFVLAAVPLAYLAAGFAKLRLVGRFVGLAAITALLALSARESYRRYFDDYDRQYDALVEHTVEITHTIQEYAGRGVPVGNVYLVNVPFWLDPRNIAFELGDPGWWVTHEIRPGAPLPQLPQRPLLFVFRPTDTGGREALRRIYPEGKESTVPQSFRDRNFGVYLVE